MEHLQTILFIIIPIIIIILCGFHWLMEKAYQESLRKSNKK